MAEAWLPWLLLGQAVVGGADTLVNHELIARLPYRAESRAELVLHALRESIYAALFIGLALFAWHGAAAWIIAALLAAEVLVTTTDEFLENRTRKLPDNERVMHVFLTVNLGLIIAVAVPVLAEWSRQPAGWARVDRGMLAWLLVALGVASAAWSLRDALAVRRLGRAQ
jgi:hypothetical protein